MKKTAAGALLFLLGGAGGASASPLGTSADVMEGRSWAVAIFGVSTEREPDVTISGVSAIQIPTTGGPATVFSQANADVSLEQSESEVGLEAAFRPGHGLTYRARVSQIRNFELEFGSGSVVNAFESARDGWKYGAGASWSLVPGSIVSTAMTLDFSYARTVVPLDRFRSGSSVFTADHRFRQDEYQAAFFASRRFGRLEPYGGLKVFRLRTKLADRATKADVGGNTEGVSPFLGLQWRMFERERLALEASFADETSIGASLRIGFGPDERLNQSIREDF